MAGALGRCDAALPACGGYPAPPPPANARIHPATGLVLAGFGHRLGARIIDYFLVNILVWLLTFGILVFIAAAYPDMEETSDAFNTTFGLLFLFGWGVAVFLYDWFFIAATGRTPGKMMTRLRVVSADGAPAPMNDHRDQDRPFSADSSRNVPGRLAASLR